MKLAEVTVAGRTVSLHYGENSGYRVSYYDSMMAGATYPIVTRQQAEEQFLWTVGYPLWRAAADKAYRKAEKQWLAAHQTLESVGAQDMRP